MYGYYCVLKTNFSTNALKCNTGKNGMEKSARAVVENPSQYRLDIIVKIRNASPRSLRGD